MMFLLSFFSFANIATPFNKQSKTTFEKSDFTLGTHNITLTVTDNDGNEDNDTLRVIVEPMNDTTPPIALLSSPTSESSVTLVSDIIGTASDKHLESYRLLLSPKGKNNFTVIAEGDMSVENDVLGKLDATTLSNGLYDLSLEVIDRSGQSSHVSTQVSIEGKAKIGNFSFTLTDFNLQVGGLPVQVNRTYSTLQRNEKLDFSYAWSIDYQNVKLQENTSPGRDWKITPDVLIGSCFKFDKSHQVSISLPDGITEKFEYRFEVECRHYFTGSFYDAPVLYALNGSEAKLKTLDASDSVMMTDNSELIDGDTLREYNPSHYRLTLSNGMSYDVKQNIKNWVFYALKYVKVEILS